jgi:hypothetical protein
LHDFYGVCMGQLGCLSARRGHASLSLPSLTRPSLTLLTNPFRNKTRPRHAHAHDSLPVH